MRAIIRTLRQQGGQTGAADQATETAVLHIGRATTQQVQLADLRVALEHAEIRLHGKGSYGIEARVGCSVWINGAPTASCKLEAGDVIRIGRYHLTLKAPPPDADLLLEVEEQVSARDERVQLTGQYFTRLDHAGLSRRRLAWLLFVLVILPALVIPLVLRYGFHTHAPQDRVWNPGPVSAAHAHFGNNCAACHGKAFEPVRNAACTVCHSDVHRHSGNPEILALPAMAQLRCTDCHQEHHGPGRLITRNPALCTGCHARPDAHFALARLPPASDFGTDHPPFTALLPRFRGGRFIYEKVSETDKAHWRQDTQLIYPHDTHLNPRGIDSPKGKVVMQCSDCHVPDASGRDFLPVSYEKHCAACHRLDFDPDAPQRLLPHRNPKEVVSIIRDFYAREALDGGVNSLAAPRIVQLRRLPGVALNPDDRRIALDWANRRAAQTVNDVFDRRVCNYCHIVSSTGDPDLPWQIAPVAPQRQLYSGALFDHAAHRMEKCASCHGAAHAKQSADVLLPGIANCRQCHIGPHAKLQVAGSAGTDCLECHRFHTAENTLFGSAAAPVPPALKLSLTPQLAHWPAGAQP